MKEIRAYSYDELEKALKEEGMPRFRAQQIFQWLYQKGATSYDDMTNLPRDMRTSLAEKAPLHSAEVVDKQISSDGTRKYVIRYHDGASTEMVAIPSAERFTVCFSTQVGCAMECAFCATGKEGFSRNLLPGEMVEQVLIAQDDMGHRVSNLVAMGQGEPFLNYDAVRDALHIFNGEKGMNIAARRITVSTCGILKGIERFAEEPEQFTLAVSLHSAIQETRDILMPRVSSAPLVALRHALERYQRASNRRITFEYVMIDGLNDDERHLKALAKFCSVLLCHVNLIPINAIEESPYKPSPAYRVRQFIEHLGNSGIEATMRESRGSDIAGACGQLKNKRR